MTIQHDETALHEISLRNMGETPNDPAIRWEVNSAVAHQAMQQAMREYHERMSDAESEAEPTLAEALELMHGAAEQDAETANGSHGLMSVSLKVLSNGTWDYCTVHNATSGKRSDGASLMSALREAAGE